MDSSILLWQFVLVDSLFWYFTCTAEMLSFVGPFHGLFHGLKVIPPLWIWADVTNCVSANLIAQIFVQHTFTPRRSWNVQRFRICKMGLVNSENEAWVVKHGSCATKKILVIKAHSYPLTKSQVAQPSKISTAVYVSAMWNLSKKCNFWMGVTLIIGNCVVIVLWYMQVSANDV